MQGRACLRTVQGFGGRAATLPEGAQRVPSRLRLARPQVAQAGQPAPRGPGCPCSTTCSMRWRGQPACSTQPAAALAAILPRPLPCARQRTQLLCCTDSCIWRVPSAASTAQPAAQLQVELIGRTTHHQQQQQWAAPWHWHWWGCRQPPASLPPERPARGAAALLPCLPELHRLYVKARPMAGSSCCQGVMRSACQGCWCEGATPAAYLGTGPMVHRRHIIYENIRQPADAKAALQI